MTLPRPRFTLGRLMAAMVLVAICLAALRTVWLMASGADAQPALGLGLLIACVLYLASIRASEEITRRRAKGETLTWRRQVHIFRISLVVAVVVIGLSDLVFFMALPFARAFMHGARSHEGYDRFNPVIYYDVHVLATFVAVLFASFLRKLLWPTEPRDPLPTVHPNLRESPSEASRTRGDDHARDTTPALEGRRRDPARAAGLRGH